MAVRVVRADPKAEAHRTGAHRRRAGHRASRVHLTVIAQDRVMGRVRAVHRTAKAHPRSIHHAGRNNQAGRA
jgi:hypothetical protein